MTLFALIRSDYRKYSRYGGRFFGIVFMTQGFWALYQYRWAHYFYSKVKIPLIRQFLLLLMLVWQKGIEIMTGISIPYSAKLGHSFYIGHFGGIILNPQSVFGNDCNISQGVTIGISGRGENRGVPVIGDRVYIGANAVVAGNIAIGNDAVIGACSFVGADVADNAVVSGVPAVVLSGSGSKAYIQ